MKKTILLLILCVHTFASKAQTVFASVQGEGIAGTMTVAYTIGEPFVTTFETGNHMLTQGFHQPYYSVVAVNAPFETGEVKVFPNPTASYLHIQLNKMNTENLEVKLFDLTGKCILISKIENTNTWQTQISHLPSGQYLLSVIDIVNHKSHVYKIFKSN